MRITRWGLLALWLCVLAAVAGCANTAARRTATGLELDLSAGADEGHVVLRVVSLRPISLLNPKWQSVHIVSAGRPNEINDITPPGNAFFSGKYFATESLYFAKLSAGRYDITGFGSVGPGPGLIPALIGSDNARAARLPAFTIEKGRLANLGTLVYAPELEGEQPQQMFLLRGPAGRQYALDSLLAESGRTQVALADGGGWAAAAAADDEQRLLAQARTQVSQLYLRASDQGVVAGTHLGQLLRRAGPHRWDRESINTLSTLFAAARMPDGRQVAGGEYGSYFVKAGNGPWQAYRLPQDTGRVVHIEPHGAGGALLVSTQGAQSRFWVRTSLADSAEVAREVAKLPRGIDLLLSTATELVMPGNIPGITRETELTRLNKSTFAIAKQTENFWVKEWQQLPAGEVVMTRQNGMSFYVSRSRDAMKTWKHEQKPAGLSNYWLDANRGYSTDSKAGFVMVENRLMKTADGGGTWQHLGKPLETRNLAGSIVFADATEVLVQGGNMLFSSTDEGRSWVRLFPPAASR